MNDRAAVILAEVAAIEEIHVDGGRDDAMRSQQPAQQRYPGVEFSFGPDCRANTAEREWSPAPRSQTCPFSGTLMLANGHGVARRFANAETLIRPAR